MSAIILRTVRPDMGVIFVTGPARSGKSAFGVRLALACEREVTYVATAAHDPEDAEWNARLARHLRDRPSEWRTVETATMPHRAQVALFAEASGDQCLLVDALGTYLWATIRRRADLLEIDYAVFERHVNREAAELVDAMLASPAQVVAVSEQIGWDVPPSDGVSRLFRDCLGRMVQRLAQASERAFLVVAGYAIDLRASGTPIQGEDEL